MDKWTVHDAPRSTKFFRRLSTRRKFEVVRCLTLCIGSRSCDMSDRRRDGVPCMECEQFRPLSRFSKQDQKLIDTHLVICSDCKRAKRWTRRDKWEKLKIKSAFLLKYKLGTIFYCPHCGKDAFVVSGKEESGYMECSKVADCPGYTVNFHS